MQSHKRGGFRPDHSIFQAAALAAAAAGNGLSSPTGLKRSMLGDLSSPTSPNKRPHLHPGLLHPALAGHLPKDGATGPGPFDPSALSAAALMNNLSAATAAAAANPFHQMYIAAMQQQAAAQQAQQQQQQSIAALQQTFAAKAAAFAASNPLWNQSSFSALLGLPQYSPYGAGSAGLPPSALYYEQMMKMGWNPGMLPQHPMGALPSPQGDRTIELPCPQCDQRFDSIHKLHSHIWDEHCVDKCHKFLCPASAHCEQQFSTEEEVIAHLKEKHTRFCCDVCDLRTFSTLGELEAHLASAHHSTTVEILKCKLCDHLEAEMFHTEEELREHIRSVHSQFDLTSSTPSPSCSSPSVSVASLPEHHHSPSAKPLLYLNVNRCVRCDDPLPQNVEQFIAHFHSHNLPRKFSKDEDDSSKDGEEDKIRGECIVCQERIENLHDLNTHAELHCNTGSSSLSPSSLCSSLAAPASSQDASRPFSAGAMAEAESRSSSRSSNMTERKSFSEQQDMVSHSLNRLFATPTAAAAGLMPFN